MPLIMIDFESKWDRNQRYLIAKDFDRGVSLGGSVVVEFEMHGCFEKRTYSRYSFLDGQIEVVLDSEENCPYTNLASHCG